MAIYDRRRRRSKVYLALCYVCVAIGLGWLALILGTLLVNGFRGLSPAIFTQMTPPPGSDGGLLNAITGSLIMTAIGVFVGEYTKAAATRGEVMAARPSRLQGPPKPMVQTTSSHP